MLNVWRLIRFEISSYRCKYSFYKIEINKRQGETERDRKRQVDTEIDNARKAEPGVDRDSQRFTMIDKERERLIE